MGNAYNKSKIQQFRLSVFAFYGMLTFFLIPCRANDFNLHLQGILTSIELNNINNNNLQLTYDYTSTYPDGSTIVWKRTVIVSNNCVRMDHWDMNVNTYILAKCGQESWKYSPKNKVLMILTTEDMSGEFVFDPRNVGTIVSTESLENIFSQFPCSSLQILEEDGEKIIRCTFDEEKNEDILIQRKMIFSSSYDYMPIEIQQLENDKLLLDIKVDYSKQTESSGWLFHEMTYLWYEPTDGDIVLDRKSPSWTQKLTIKVSHSPFDVSVSPSSDFFLVPKDLPSGTIVNNTIRKTVSIIEDKNLRTNKLFEENNTFYVKIILVGLGILCIVMAIIFRKCKF
jgi:hypothetical protein